jgi:hypothetical protein
MSGVILALVYVGLGYVIAMIRCSGRELRAFADGLRQGQQIARDEAEVSLHIE